MSYRIKKITIKHAGVAANRKVVSTIQVRNKQTEVSLSIIYRFDFDLN